MPVGNPPKGSGRDSTDRTELGERAHGMLRGENASPEHAKARITLRGAAAQSKAAARAARDTRR